MPLCVGDGPDEVVAVVDVVGLVRRRGTGHADAVVVLGPDAGAVIAQGRVPSDQFLLGEGAVIGYNLLAGIAGCRLVKGRAVLDNPILGGGRTRWGWCRRGGGQGSGGCTRNADAVIVLGPDTGTVLTDSRVPSDEIVKSESAVLVNDLLAGIASGSLVKGDAGVD